MSPSWCLIFIMFFGWTSDDACGYSCFYHVNVPFSAPCVQRTPAVTTQLVLETTSSMLWLRRIHLLPQTMFWLISFDYLGDQEKGICVLFFFHIFELLTVSFPNSYQVLCITGLRRAREECWLTHFCLHIALKEMAVTVFQIITCLALNTQSV